MDPFVRRLIQRLHQPSQPLSRNRHFHTFNSPEGRLALRTSRRLKSLQRDLLTCAGEGCKATFTHQVGVEGQHRVELTLKQLNGRRVSILDEDEFALLCELPGVQLALGGQNRAQTSARTGLP